MVVGVSSVASFLCAGGVASGMTSMSCTSQKSKHYSLDTVVVPLPAEVGDSRGGGSRDT